MTTILIISLTMVFTFLILIFIGWVVHISIVNDCTEVLGWANYETFIREFNKYSWDNENYGGQSLWDRKNNCKFHADIIYFNGIGMKMITPFDWFLMHLYVRNYVKSNKFTKKPIKEKYNWHKNIYS